MFVVILFLLGFACGYAVGWPWALVCFIVPVGLVLTATDKSGGSIVVFRIP